MPDANLAQFNYKLLHNIVVNRSDLFKWKKIQYPICIYCGNVETTKHIYFDCKYVKNMWYKIGKILNMCIQWKHLVLGVQGDNITVLFRNFMYTVIMYALYKNWCRDSDLGLQYNGDVNMLNCKKDSNKRVIFVEFNFEIT